jgi:hypothetical protein
MRLWSMMCSLSHLLLDGMLPGTDPDALARALPPNNAGPVFRLDTATFDYDERNGCG